jgi:hypothetical protein
MRIAVASVALVLSLGAAFAQGAEAPASDRSKARAGTQAADDGVPECMRLWDAKTHMSRQEWARTCKRIQTRLDNLKIESLDTTGTDMRKRVGKQGSIGATGRAN